MPLRNYGLLSRRSARPDDGVAWHPKAGASIAFMLVLLVVVLQWLVG